MRGQQAPRARLHLIHPNPQPWHQLPNKTGAARITLTGTSAPVSIGYGLVHQERQQAVPVPPPPGDRLTFEQLEPELPVDARDRMFDRNLLAVPEGRLRYRAPEQQGAPRQDRACFEANDLRVSGECHRLLGTQVRRVRRNPTPQPSGDHDDEPLSVA